MSSWLKGKRVAVTGGAGLIGSFLVDRLVDVGANVTVADNLSRGKWENLASSVKHEVRFRNRELTMAREMENSLWGAEVVIHLASWVHGIGADDHLGNMSYNGRITANLIDSLSQDKIGHLVVASSSCVYSDDGPDVIPETMEDGDPEKANRGYGWSKRFLEQQAKLLSVETGTPLLIVRPFNIYGERYAWAEGLSQAIPMLVHKVMRGDDPVVVWGSGEQRRNYMHASDCAAAIIDLLERRTIGTINIGWEDTVSLMELAQTICKVAGRSPKLVADPSRPEGRRVKAADASLLRACCPGFKPLISLEEGIERMLRWHAATFL